MDRDDLIYVLRHAPVVALMVLGLWVLACLYLAGAS